MTVSQCLRSECYLHHQYCVSVRACRHLDSTNTLHRHQNANWCRFRADKNRHREKWTHSSRFSSRTRSETFVGITLSRFQKSARRFGTRLTPGFEYEMNAGRVSTNAGPFIYGAPPQCLRAAMGARLLRTLTVFATGDCAHERRARYAQSMSMQSTDRGVTRKEKGSISNISDRTSYL